MERLNDIKLKGFLGNRPEVRELAGGKKVATVSLATLENARNADGAWFKQTSWHRLVFWDKWAHFAELNLDKGLGLYVEGRTNQRTYTDRNGESRTVTEVVVTNAVVTKGRA